LSFVTEQTADLRRQRKRKGESEREEQRVKKYYIKYTENRDTKIGREPGKDIIIRTEE
jgi:hypothetical protein